MEQLIFIAVIALISFINWLMQRSSELREKRRLERKRDLGEDVTPEPPRRPGPLEAPRPAAPDPAAEMRKFMEALGLPVEAPEPEKYLPRAPEPPPLPTFEEVIPPPTPQPVRRTVEPRAPAQPAAKVTSVETSPWLKILQTRDGVRQAVVLREVLGAPKAFTL